MFNPRISRRQALKILALAGVAGPGWPGGKSSRAAETAAGVATFRVTGRTLKILAVTDLHFFGRTPLHDRMTLHEIRKMIAIFQPGLLIADGDTWYNNPRGQGKKHCEWTCNHLGKLGIPWAFVRGNHDQADDFGACERLLSAAPNSLFAGSGTQANYRIDLADAEGKVRWRLIILNDSAPEMGFKEPQIEWLRSEVSRIRQDRDPEASALLFCHIPLPAFEDLVRQGKAEGILREKVISYEQGSAQAFPAIRDTGLVRAVFCGHDHLNNFRGEMEGVHLEYVRATGYGGYGRSKVRKGGTLISLDLAGPGSGFQTLTVFADGATWTPEGKTQLPAK
jgi:3',5'-cyclic AMP phosphodiesterase CpdA